MNLLIKNKEKIFSEDLLKEAEQAKILFFLLTISIDILILLPIDKYTNSKLIQIIGVTTPLLFKILSIQMKK